ncbi:hypothetical protein [Actinoplanes sp. GCM10030250]|uniref:hypothetical protein n=1 Tax=Actinoplanes sp. GCM10030250 TaxID=3273376 RepID=UPI00360C49E7
MAMGVLRRGRAGGALRSAAVVRTGWGLALLIAPEVLLRMGGRATAPPVAVTVARVLGTRQLVQAVVTTALPAGRVAGVSAAVDAMHAATGAVLAVMSARWRPVALVDMTVAAGLAAAGWAGRRP